MIMNCVEWERLLDAHLDGQLGGALRLEFDTHRLHCPHCQQTLAMMEAIGNVITNDDQTPALSINFADRVMARIEQRQNVTPWYRRRWVVATAGLANIAALVGIAMIFPRGSAPAQKPTTPIAAAAVDIRGMDPIDLADYIWSRADAARRNVSSDLRQIAQIPLGFTVPDGMNMNSLGDVMEMLAPGAADNADRGEGETHSL